VLLLDLDDTIIADTASGVEPCWRAACAEPAVKRGLDAEALYQAIRTTADWYWGDPARHRQGRADLRVASASIVEKALRSLDVADPALARRISDDYRDRRDAGLCLFPDSIAAIEALRARGIRLGMITNGATADQRGKIERFKLASYFDHIQIEGEFGLGKPEPEVYWHALAALCAAPDETWMAGDNLEWDVAAPQRLGIGGVWVDVARGGLPAGSDVRPDRIIRTLSELLA
jgi:putative hydrolase of the HAD superfamily